MTSERSIPILPSRDLLRTRPLYESLGFHVGYFAPRGHDRYRIFTRGELELQFSGHAELDPSTNDAGCYWRVSDADAWHAECARLELGSAGIPRVTQVEDKPWGMREFALVDEDGNLVRIGQRLVPS